MNEENNNPTIAKIKNLYSTMTNGQKQLADYIIENPSQVVNQSISTLLRHTSFKSEASVVQFYHLLGFTSFKTFKITLAQELASRTFYHSQTDITLDDEPGEIKRKVFIGAINSLTQNASYEIDECIKVQHLLFEASRIIIIGHGASSAICQYAYFRFSELGLNCIYNLDSHMNVSLFSHASNRDIILCISQSGETSDIYKQIAQGYKKCISTILITGNAHSSIAKISKCVLSTLSEEKNVLTDALSSRITQFCLIDALFTMISITNSNDTLQKLEETREEFKSYKLL